LLSNASWYPEQHWFISRFPSSSFLSIWSQYIEDEDEYRTSVERYWQGEPDNTQKPVTVPLCALEIPHELAMHRNLAFVYRQRWSWHGLHACLQWSRLQRGRTSEKTLCCHKECSCCISHRQCYCSNICMKRLVTFT
jgi:hypothetical protein